MSIEDSLGKRAREMFAVIERYQSTELTQKSFCAAEGLALSTFQYWHSRYKAHQQQDTSARLPERFVELKPWLQTQGVGDGAIVISYPNGVTLRLGTAANLKLLKELINL